MFYSTQVSQSIFTFLENYNIDLALNKQNKKKTYINGSHLYSAFNIVQVAQIF